MSRRSMDKAQIVGEMPLAITRMSVAVANVEGGISGISDTRNHQRKTQRLGAESRRIVKWHACPGLDCAVRRKPRSFGLAPSNPGYPSIYGGKPNYPAQGVFQLTSNHLEDTFQGFFNVLPTIERAESEIAFSSRAKSAAGGSDDMSFAQQQIKEIPTG